MILTEQEISLLAHNIDDGDWNDLNYQKCWHEGFVAGARAIESAVLEKLKAQEPFAFHHDEEGLSYSNHYTGTIPLYRHPLPPDDVVQKYEELLYAVQRKFPDETRHQTALRYIKTAESPSYTNAAMKEMK